MTETELRVTLAPMSSAHRSRAVAELCEQLNATSTTFPGSHLVLRFAMADAPAPAADVLVTPPVTDDPRLAGATP